MKTSIIIGLLASFLTSPAMANPFIKGCDNYNQVSVHLLDSLIPASEKTPEQNAQEIQSSYPGPSEMKKSVYHGQTTDGRSCTVQISRTNQAQCSIFSKRYIVAIETETEVSSAKYCGAAIVMDADLDLNSENTAKAKSTDVYPRFFATAYGEFEAVKNESGIQFSCHSYSKEKKGYQQGHESRNDCQISLQ